MHLPELGVGLVCLPGFEAIVEAVAADCGVVEVEPQPYWLKPADPAAGFHLNAAAFDRLERLGKPLLVHSVGHPVGGSAPGDPRQLEALGETLGRLKPAWWSEHMSFIAAGSGAQRRSLGFLMPPVQTRRSMDAIVGRVNALQDRFGLPFAFETGVNYLRPLDGEIPDGAFWGEIAERADCGILLDLHNVWTNQRNGRQPVEDLTRQLPLGRVWELHLAGGQEHEGYWLDAHSSLPPDELMELAGRLVGRLPALRAILFEIIPDYVAHAGLTASDLSRTLAAMRALWDARNEPALGHATAPAPTHGPARAQAPASGRALPSPAQWEAGLHRALTADGADRPEPFSHDPGIGIYRDLIATVRRGTIAEALPLTARYMLLGLGEDAFHRALGDFWRSSDPQLFMSDESRNFASHVASRRLLPHLHEVAAFELAAHHAALSGTVQQVTFTCPPEPLLMALKQNRQPPPLPEGAFEVDVLPPAVAASA